MKTLDILIAYAATVTLCGGAIALAINDIGGWGWFLFVAYLVCPANIITNNK